MRTNGRRPEGGEVEGKGEGTRETALAAQWEDYPMPGLVAAAAAARTGGSVLGGGVPSSRSSSTSVSEQKASSFITDRHLKGRGERRVQLGQSELGEQIPAERE